MSYTITILEQDYNTLRTHLFRDAREQAAFLLAGYSSWSDGAKLMVQAVVPVPDDGFREQCEDRLVIAPEFTNQVIKRASLDDQAIVLVHSHPGAGGRVVYSPTDDVGERDLFKAFYQRATKQPHASMVFGNNVASGRFWFTNGTVQPADKLLVVGTRLQILPLNGYPLPSGGSELHDRQVRALGEAGQAHLSTLTVAVVGLGGTGSVTAEQLVRLGVGQVIVIDNDVIELSNVSRVYGSTLVDSTSRTGKVFVAARQAEAVGSNTITEAIDGSILDEDVALTLRRADVVFGCTDTHWSRSILNTLAYRYYIPVVDMGVRIDSDGSSLLAMVGRVSIIQPGAPCLLCCGVIDPHQVYVESLPTDQRTNLAEEGYVRGAEIAAPAVISLNTVVSGLAVTAFLNLVTGFGGHIKHRPQVIYDALQGTIKQIQYRAMDGCHCNQPAYLGVGDAQRLPCRPPIQLRAS